MSAVPSSDPMSILDQALACIDLGWALCSIRPGTKGPTTPGWNKPGAVISTREAAVAEFTRNPSNGIGLIHGPSGTCAIDVDDSEFFSLILAEYGIDLDTLFAAAPRVIGRKGRDKAIFRVPDGFDCGRRSLVWPKMTPDGKPVTVFELRAGDIQDVLPPTIHPDTGQPYQWREGTEPFGRQIPMLPEQLIALWTAWDAFKPQLMALCPWAPADLALPIPPPRARAIPAGNRNVIGQFNDAHDVRAILVANGYEQRGKRYLAPTSGTGLAGVVILDESHCYSHHASDPLNDGHAHDAFDLFCRFEHGGDVARAVRCAADLMQLQRLPDIPIISTQPLIANALARKLPAGSNQPIAPEQGMIPGELTRVPGVLGEFVDHIIASAIKPQRVLAVAAALSFGAICMARKYASRTNLRTNPYIIAVAPSTAGKEHGRRMVKNALLAAGLKDRIGGEDIKSGSAVFSAAYRSPAIVFQLDEFGLFLKSVMNPSSGSYQAEIMRQLLTLRTSQNTVVMGPEYAANHQAGERKDVEYPCVILHGTTTGDTFWPALSSREVLSGFLNRCTVVHAEGPGVRQPSARPESDIPMDVIEWAAQISHPERMADANLIGISPAAPRIISESPIASRMLAEFADQCDREAAALIGTGVDVLWGRAHAQAIEYALIVAGSLCARDPIITEGAASWAIAFVEYWTRRLVADCQSRIVDTEFEGQCASVLRVIQRGATCDRSYTRREIAKAWRGWRSLRPHEQDAILDALVRNGDAVEGKRQGARGPAAAAWIAREFSGDLNPGDDQDETKAGE